MNYFPRSSALFLATLAVCAVTASADDLIPIKVTNDNTENIYVSLYDMNTTPPSRLLAHELINGFASVPISVSADSSGNAHVYWTAVTADPTMRKCGRKDKPRLSSDASVHVYAKSDCPSQ